MTTPLSFRAPARHLYLVAALASHLAAQPSDTANASRARAVVMRHMEAIGGMDAYAAVQSVHMVLLIRMPVAAMDLRAEMWTTKPNLVYMHTRSPVTATESGFDGKVGWILDEVEGARILTGPPELLNAAAFDPLAALVRYDVKYLGVRERGGRKMEALHMIAGDGQPYIQYFDAETGLFARLEAGDPSAPVSSIRLDRYRKFDRLLYATVYTTKVQDGYETVSRVLKVDHKPVDPKRYEPPKAVRDLLARQR